MLRRLFHEPLGHSISKTDRLLCRWSGRSISFDRFCRVVGLWSALGVWGAGVLCVLFCRPFGDSRYVRTLPWETEHSFRSKYSPPVPHCCITSHQRRVSQCPNPARCQPRFRLQQLSQRLVHGPSVSPLSQQADTGVSDFHISNGLDSHNAVVSPGTVVPRPHQHPVKVTSGTPQLESPPSSKSDPPTRSIVKKPLFLKIGDNMEANTHAVVQVIVSSDAH